MLELLSAVKMRDEERNAQKWYVEHQMAPNHEKGFKPVFYKILDTIGL